MWEKTLQEKNYGKSLDIFHTIQNKEAAMNIFKGII